jgi:hypothetical protein
LTPVGTNLGLFATEGKLDDRWRENDISMSIACTFWIGAVLGEYQKPRFLLSKKFGPFHEPGSGSSRSVRAVQA